MKIIFENEYGLTENLETVADGIYERHYPQNVGFLELDDMRYSFPLLSNTIPSDYTIQQTGMLSFEAWTIGEEERIFLMEGYLDDIDRKTAAETLTKFIENPELFEQTKEAGQNGIWSKDIFYTLKP